MTAMSSRYKVMPSGALHITNANEDDVGIYTCRGENALGGVEQTTTIKLLSKILFITIRRRYYRQYKIRIGEILLLSLLPFIWL